MLQTIRLALIQRPTAPAHKFHHISIDQADLGYRFTS
jgi:hypothetical protein